MIHHDVVIDDVEKFDTIEDGFVHYQLLRFFRLHTSSTLTPTFLDKVGMLPVNMIVDSNTRTCTRKSLSPLETYLADDAGPVNFFTDLRVTHEHWGSSSNPMFNKNCIIALTLCLKTPSSPAY